MTTLFTATLDLSKILQNTPEGTATGGSTTTLEDSLRGEMADYFDGGTIWFLSGNNANKSTAILDWITTKFTFATQAASCAAGNRYAAASGEFSKWLLIQAVNDALNRMNALRYNQALTTTAYQERYSLPGGVYNVKRVEVSIETTDPYDFIPNYNWREVGGLSTGDANNKATLVFDAGHAPALDGCIIRLTYQPERSDLTADADEIDDLTPILPLVWSAAVYALRWKLGVLGRDKPEKVDRLNEALLNAQVMASKYPMHVISPDPHHATW
jgi:hypothetical protein